MIEKEAKELFNKKPLGYEMKPELEIYTDGFKDGYNKAKEEMQKNGLALQSDMDKTIEQNIVLKKLIEKMKCCQNCKHFDKLYNRCELTRLTLKSCLCNSLNKWEIKKIDKDN